MSPAAEVPNPDHLPTWLVARTAGQEVRLVHGQGDILLSEGGRYVVLITDERGVALLALPMQQSAGPGDTLHIDLSRALVVVAQ
jgi:hypothetical protein